ncbi:MULTISPECIES: universal stress protein [Halococcus]|uniref:UspA domain-containing protein n=1 Tax=Halococcus salifodinae DSM 8989 TaxID=1227456 RepID=M0MV48_9EURY|nr:MULTISPECIES: universal stress protein [Halococcus]EMA48664.1 UspA domain-containing protein [Halococcus salifodinae DSM 8989]
MYDRILFPTDGSNQASALEHAVDIAELSGGTLHTLYVVDDAEIPETNRNQIVDSYEREGANAIEHVEDVAAERDVAVMGDIEQGTPHEAILNYADEHDIDLVVMGTRGRSGLDRLLIGSVTERVVRASDVPVLTVSLSSHEAAITDTEQAIDLATRSLEDDGYEVTSIADEPYRVSGTWIVRARTGDNGTFNVHINRATGDVSLAKVN